LQNNIAQPRGDNLNGATSYATKEGSGTGGRKRTWTKLSSLGKM